MNGKKTRRERATKDAHAALTLAHNMAMTIKAVLTAERLDALDEARTHYGNVHLDALAADLRTMSGIKATETP